MKHILPVKIVDMKGVTNAESLLKEKTVQIGLNETDVCVMDEGSHIILDFGRECVGSLRVLTATTIGSGRVRIRLGESVSESCSDIGDHNATNDHAVRDWECNLPNLSDETFIGSGFRFARIDLSEDTKLRLKSVLLEDCSYENPFDGSFSCDDELVNKIFDTAAYTFRLCIQNDMIWDGIKRDRLVWIGDIHPEQMTANSLYSDTYFIKNSIKFVCEQTPLPLWMNNIPMYSLWWIINLRDYYFKTGDYEFLSSFRDYLKGLISQIDGVIKEDGNTAYPFNFIDWPSHSREEDGSVKAKDQYAGVHALTVWALKCAKEIFEVLKEDDKIIVSSLVKLSKISHTVEKYKQISAIRLISGEGDEKDVKLILDGGAKGLSTFMSYYILSSVATRGYGKEALDMMKEYYGKMIELGATTFWEDFDISWAENAGRIDELPNEDKVDIHAEYGDFCYKGFRHSFCHGWSSGVVPFLVRIIAGINETAVGGKELTIKPCLSGLKKVDVVYPTVNGNVKVKIRDVDGNVKIDYEAPDGVKVVL